MLFLNIIGTFIGNSSGEESVKKHNDLNRYQNSKVLILCIMEKNDSLLKVKVLPNAPLLIEGTVEITLTDGTTVVKNNPHLCRCGASKNKPYCDGSHAKIDFKG